MNWTPPQTTWVMREQGSAFDPETCCEYTGLALWCFPMEIQGEPVLMGYWRADGYLRRCRLLTPEEKAWISANPSLYTEQRRAFEAWLASTR